MTKRSAKPPALNPKQLRFVDLYLVSLNATKAYQEAYRCSDTVANRNGPRLLVHAGVAALIASRAEERAKRVQVDADTVLRELLRMAQIDVGNAYDDNNCLLPIKQIPEDTRRAISAVDTDEIWEQQGKERVLVGHTRKVKFWDKRASNVDLGRHLKLFIDRVEHEAGESLADLILAARNGKSDKGKA